MSLFSKISSHFLAPSSDRLLEDGAINMFWFSGEANIGDVISPYIVSSLAKREVKAADKREHPKLLAVGSIMHYARAGDVVWGTGVISDNARLKSKRIRVAAVRGPRTRAYLLRHGVDCPEIYGDPAILMPELLNVGPVEKKYSLGIVPHYKDTHLVNVNDPSIKIISVTEDASEFVANLMSCERIVSSSLHGIILAESYGVPADWVKLSENLVGGEFKFYDYYEGTGRCAAEPLDYKMLYQERDIEQANFERNKLINAFPM